MKNQWPFWLFIIAILVVVLISMNYHGKDDVVSLGDIFPEQQGAFDYEYVSEDDEELVDKVEVAAKKIVKEPVIEKVTEPQPVASKPEVKSEEVSAPMVTTTITGKYTIQILASKDKKATEQALLQAKEHGFNNAFIKPANPSDNETWHRIYIGGFPSVSEAKKVLPKVKEHYREAFIVNL